ncbi:signal peptidase I [bacterium]|nr:signal peptidase I [bacterium]
MSKSKPTAGNEASGGGKTGAAAAKATKKHASQDGGRETFESIVVAFILAFLFRAFEAEAFVIPTGSMAPTLYGRHKEMACEQCGFKSAIGASDEVDDATGLYLPNMRIDEAMCPNCRYLNPVRNLPVFKGDRILVNKFPYEFGAPRRWDVPVFKYPEKPTTNYIKRLVGLPNETLLIKRGDVYRVEDDRSRTILRKAPGKQKELQIPVYDNNHPETALHDKGWPKRWACVEKSDPAVEPVMGPVAGWVESATGWQTSEDSRSFSLTAEQAAAPRWLRYRHYVPRQEDWYEALAGDSAPRDPAFFADAQSAVPRPQLITDFCGYNTYVGGHGSLDSDCYWVGDLTVSGRINLEQTNAQSELTLELNEGVRAYRVRIDLRSGKAKLISVLRFAGTEEEETLAEADTRMSGSGRYRFRFANVDNRVCLWIDGRLTDFGSAAEYTVDESLIPSPQNEDLTPVGIALQNASATVSDLLIERDIYYRASQIDNDEFDRFSGGGDEEHPWPSDLRRALQDPAKWYEVYDARDREAQFTLGDDEYLMLGDNSPRSQDSRVWPNSRGAEHRHAVPGSALVGRAFFIYWPHGIPFLNNGHGYPSPLWGYHYEAAPQGGIRKSDYPDLRIPFYPNFGRMHRIR